MALHPEFPESPYAELLPEQRWFPAAEELRSTAYEKLLPPLVAKIRGEVTAWECGGSPPLSEPGQAPENKSGSKLPHSKSLQTEYEERWTGSYIFENEWQSFRTRKNRELELTSAPHTYTNAGRYTVAVKVIDIFGNDTMTLVPVNVG